MSSVGCSACQPPTSSTACFRYIVFAPEKANSAPYDIWERLMSPMIEFSSFC
jgi:hypothetical protein